MSVKLGKTIKQVIRGDTRQEAVTFLEADGTTPIDLTGGTMYFTVNASEDPSNDTTAVIQKTATSFTSALTGQHTFTLSHTDTNIAAGDYWYDVEFIDALGNYLSSYRGKFLVQSDTTRT